MHYPSRGEGTLGSEKSESEKAPNCQASQSEVRSIARRVLDATKGSVGLIIDHGAIEPIASDRARIRRARISRHGCVTQEGSVCTSCRTRLIRRCTGVLVYGNDETPRLATASHCIHLDEDVRAQVRVIVGLGPVAREFSRTQIVEPVGVKHLEDLPGRDLAIFSVRGDSSLPGCSLPVESLELEDDEPVFVVGHAAGRDLDVYEGKLVTRRPMGRAFASRGYTVELLGYRDLLSGSPAFVWRNGAPILVGVLERQEDQFRHRLKRELYSLISELAGGNRQEQSRILRAVEGALLLAELPSLLDHEGHDHGSITAAFRMACQDCSIPDRSLAVSSGCTPSMSYLARVEESLGTLLPDLELGPLLAFVGAEPCTAAPRRQQVYIVALHGALSSNLYS